MIKFREIEWIEPLEIGKKIATNYHDEFFVLYSGLAQKIKGSKSYIGIFLKNKYKFEDFLQLTKYYQVSNRNLKLALINYESRNKVAKVSKGQNFSHNNITIAEFNVILECDHDDKSVKIYYDDIYYFNMINDILQCNNDANDELINVVNISSNFTDKSYLSAIKTIKKNIANGDFYQVNLTRKYYGKLIKTYSNDILFKNFIKLCNLSPANYAAFIFVDDKHIISSSPELFLLIEGNDILSRPIKGSVARKDNNKDDLLNIKYLSNSEKEKAENLMIVDLVRNDLSIISKPNSVKVDKLFKIDSYKTIHHMSSEISAIIKDQYNIIDAIDASFPPGSMTGAPKIAAMKNIAHHEKLNRGIYSGTIGMIGYKRAILSVVIRTLIIKGDEYEFQVGGAITHDSVANNELCEIKIKAKAICAILNIEQL